jgi:repressor LexA
MDKLTRRQEEILQFIKKYIVSNGYPPTIREIGSSLGLSSPATIHSHLGNLESKGYIKKDENKNRAIELLIENEFIQKDESIVSVPLLGKITAGNPIEAIHNPNEYFSLPAYMIPNRKEVFTLKVSGESMINSGIYDGDIVVVERRSDAKNGEIVVAMTSENEVTLKRFFKEKTYIRLHPENNYMEDIILDSVTIIGKAIGLYRKF